MKQFGKNSKKINERKIMIITIAGTPGSGKSTIAKKLVEDLNAKRVYVGGIRREYAKEKGMTLQELNEYAKAHPESDPYFDNAAAQKARELAKEGYDVIVEGRVQFHFLQESLKIYIKVSPEIAAERIFKETQDANAQAARNEKAYSSKEELAEQVKIRMTEDTKRYLKYYQIDDSDESQYDFVLDTGDITAEVATEKVLEFVRERKD